MRFASFQDSVFEIDVFATEDYTIVFAQPLFNLARQKAIQNFSIRITAEILFFKVFQLKQTLITILRFSNLCSSDNRLVNKEDFICRFEQ